MHSLENPWKTLGTEEKYDNPWIRVIEDQVVRPDGSPGIYGTVQFKNWAIAIVPLAENGDTWLVGQYRYPLGAYSWEIPEGGGPVGIDPLVSAQRELKEETGIRASHWELVLEMDLSNSTTNERSYSYIARGLSLGESEPDGDEVLQLRRLPIQEAYRMAVKGEFRDALTIATLLKVGQMLRLQV
jgi:8-oxo-dGTP pyrophosphatase MutT (NUDIX family)